MSQIIGLTGPTGAGKSLLAPLAEEFGFFVVDCDKTARLATEPGKPGLSALTEVFGSDILNPDGSLNRKALAQKAFADPDSTALLNRTVLPYIADMIRAEIVNKNALLDAPTLFESGIDRICSVTVALLAEKSLRLARIMERDGLTKEEALLRIGAGKPDAFYRENADYVLYNNGNPDELKQQFRQILTKITGGHQNDET